MTGIDYLDHLELDWFVLDVVRAKARKLDWVALMIDVNPDELNICTCDFPALFYVDPNDYRPGRRTVQQGWFCIPGKYRSKDAAWDALQDMMATRH